MDTKIRYQCERRETTRGGVQSLIRGRVCIVRSVGTRVKIPLSLSLSSLIYFTFFFCNILAQRKSPVDRKITDRDRERNDGRREIADRRNKEVDDAMDCLLTERNVHRDRPTQRSTVLFVFFYRRQTMSLPLRGNFCLLRKKGRKLVPFLLRPLSAIYKTFPSFLQTLSVETDRTKQRQFLLCTLCTFLFSKKDLGTTR